MMAGSVRLLTKAILAAVILLRPMDCHAAGESAPLAYKLHCMGCHQEDGLGVKDGLIPPIPGIAGHFLKHKKGRLYLVNVPGVVNSALPASETASLLNYVLKTWSSADMPHDAAPFTAQEIDELRRVQVPDISALRKEIMSDLSKEGIDIRYPQNR